jgi:hypothetical protein
MTKDIIHYHFCLRRPGGSFYKNRPLDPRKNFLLEVVQPSSVFSSSSFPFVSLCVSSWLKLDGGFWKDKCLMTDYKGGLT